MDNDLSEFTKNLTIGDFYTESTQLSIAEYILIRKIMCRMNNVQFDSKDVGVEHIPNLVRAVANFDEPSVQIGALKMIRKTISYPADFIVKEVLKKFVMPHLVEAVKREDNTELQYQAACTLTEFTKGSEHDTEAVVNAGAVPRLVELLRSPVTKLRAQAVWALGNIAADGIEQCNVVLFRGSLLPLMALIGDNTPIPLLHLVVYGIRQLVQYRDSMLTMAMMVEIITGLKVLVHREEPEIVADVLRILSHVVQLSASNRSLLLNSGMPLKIVDLLGNDNDEVVEGAIQLIYEISYDCYLVTKFVLNQGALLHMIPLLQHKLESVRLEAVKFTTNVASMGDDFVDSIIALDLMTLIAHNFILDSPKMADECLFFVLKFNYNSNAEQKSQLVAAGFVPPLVSMLGHGDSTDLMVVMSALEVLLDNTKDDDALAELRNLIKEHGGLQYMHDFLYHLNPSVTQAAFKIINAFFYDDVDPITLETVAIRIAQNQFNH